MNAMLAPEGCRHSGLRVSYDSAVLLEDDILATLRETDHAQNWPRDSGSLHFELEGDAFAAAASEVKFTLVLDLAVVGCEVVQPVARAIAFAQLVLWEGSWVADVIDGA